MARKRKSSISPQWVIGSAVLLGVIVIGALVFTGSDSGSSRTLQSLDVSAYLENANSLRGNIYKIKGTVSESLSWSPDSGRLIAIEVDSEILPVLVSPDFSGMNIQKQQKLEFVVEVNEKGILKTKKISKS